MADEQIVTSIVAKADLSSLVSEVHRATASLQQLQRELLSSNKSIAAATKVSNNLFSDNLVKSGLFSSHFVNLTSDVEKFGKNLDSGRLKLKEFSSVFQTHARTSGGLIRELAKEQVMLQNAILQPLGRNAQGLMQFNVAVPRGLDLVKNKAALARMELQIMNKTLSEGSTAMVNWGKNTQWAGRQLTVGLTVPLAMFGAAAAKAFREADQELVRLTKVYGDIAGSSAQDLSKIRKEVIETSKELSKAMGVNFKETISLAADIAATGKQGNDLLGSVKETTRLAVLGEIDRQDAMKATLSLQTAFKLNTDELSKSINFLNAVENQTSTTLNDLVEAIPKAGPIIQGLGGDVKDLALYLTAMREGGINASEGANALKSGLASLINPTKVATDRFKGFGIDLMGIVQNNAGDVTATLLSLQKALEKLNPLQKQQALEQLFGKFQFARMNALFSNLGKQGSQTLQVMDLMKASSEDLANVAGRELAQVTESASGKYKRAIEGLKSDMAQVGEQFLKIGTIVIGVIDKVINFFNMLPKPLKQALTFLGGLTAVAGPLIMLTGVLANFFGYIIKGVVNLRAFFKGASGWKMLTPEIIAAEKAAKLVEKSFYSDAAAAQVLDVALKKLISDYANLNEQMLRGAVPVNPSVATVQGSAIMSGNASTRREVDPTNRLSGDENTRAMAHILPRDPQRPASLMGVVPAAIPVNRGIQRAPQIYMDQRLPDYEGLTSVKGISTGIVSGEAARFHALMATLGMQTKAEVESLKKTIALGGTVSSELLGTFDDILPITSRFTQEAATGSAAIVAELKAGKMTVDQAKARIMALNAEIETMMGSALTSFAGSRGRTLNLNRAPLMNQPVVDANGQFTLRDLYKKQSNRAVMEEFGRLRGVRTFGAPYSIETTRLPRFYEGGRIEGFDSNKTTVSGPTSINYDDRLGNVPVGGYVLNQQASMDPANADLVAMAPQTYLNSGGEITANLTPGETVFGPKISKDPELYAAVDAANNGYSFGGQIKRGLKSYGRQGPGSRYNADGTPKFERGHVAMGSASDIKDVRAQKGYTDSLGNFVSYKNTVSVAKGIPIWMTADANQETRSTGRGMTGPELANEFQKAIKAGRHPFEPWMTASDNLGGDPGNQDKFNKVFKEMIGKLKKDSRVFGGQNGDLTFEQWFQKEILPSRSFNSIKVGSKSFKSLFNSVIQPYGPRGEKTNVALRTLVRGASGLTQIEKSNLSSVAKGLLGTYSGKSYNSSRQALAKLMAKMFLKRNKGGGIPGGSISANRSSYGLSPRLEAFRLAQQARYAAEHERNMARSPWIREKIKAYDKSILNGGIMDKISARVSSSRFKRIKPTNFGTLETESTGHSFPVAGIGGVWLKPDGSRSFVKPQLNERSAIASLRATEIARRANGLNTPKQTIRTMIDPTDPTGKRKVIVLESPYDPRLSKGGRSFTQKQYIRQLVASLVRNDKDLSSSNVFGNNMADEGAGGVFGRASGQREYNFNLPSMAQQATVNLLGVKGGARKDFAMATSDIARKMTPDQYHHLMIEEINRVLPKLKQVIKSFKLTRVEAALYQKMVKRLEAGRSVDWRKYHDMHSKVPGFNYGGPITSGKRSYGKKGNPAARAEQIRAKAERAASYRGSSESSYTPSGNPQMQVMRVPYVGGSGVAGNAFGALPTGQSQQHINALQVSQIGQLPAGITQAFKSLTDSIKLGTVGLRYGIATSGNYIGTAYSDAGKSMVKAAKKAATQAEIQAKMARSLLRNEAYKQHREAGTLNTQYKPTAITGPIGLTPWMSSQVEGVGTVESRKSGYLGFRKTQYQVDGQAITRQQAVQKGLVAPRGAMSGGAGMGMMMGGQMAGMALMQKNANLGMGVMVGSSVLPMLAPKIASGATALGKGVVGASKALVAGKFSAKAFVDVLTKFKFAGPVGAIIALGTAAYMLKKRLDQVHQNTQLTFGMTEKGAEQAGIKYFKLADTMKLVSERQKAMFASAKGAYEGSSVPGLTLSITELKKEKENAKKNLGEFVDTFSSVGQDNIIQTATNIKAQFLAAGMSVEEANKKIYASISVSKNASSAFAVLSDAGFMGITDKATAAKYSIESFSKVLDGSIKDSGFDDLKTATIEGISSVINSFSQYQSSLVGTKDEFGKIITAADAFRISMEKLASVPGFTKEMGESAFSNLPPEFQAISNSADSIAGMLAKWQLYSSDIVVNFKEISSEAAIGLAAFNSAFGTAMNNLATAAGPSTTFSTMGKTLTGLKKIIDSNSRASARAAAQSQRNAEDEIKAINKKIKLIQDEADAKLKAMQKIQDAESYQLNSLQTQLEYQDAIARGDMAAAAQAQIKQQQLTKEYQMQLAQEAIRDDADKKAAAAQKKAEAVQASIDAAARRAAIAAEKSADAQAASTAITAFKGKYENLLQQRNDIQFLDPSKQGAATKTSNENLTALFAEIQKSGTGNTLLAKSVKEAFEKLNLFDKNGKPVPLKTTTPLIPGGVMGTTGINPTIAGTVASDIAAANKQADSIVKGIAGGMTIKQLAVAMGYKVPGSTPASGPTGKIGFVPTTLGSNAGAYAGGTFIQPSALKAAGVKEVSNGQYGSTWVGVEFLDKDGKKWKVVGEGGHAGLSIKKAGYGQMKIDPKVPTIVGDRGPELVFGNMVIPNMSDVPYSSPRFDVQQAQKFFEPMRNSGGGGVNITNYITAPEGMDIESLSNRVTMKTIKVIKDMEKNYNGQVGPGRTH